MNVEQATIAELRKQRDDLLAENAILRKRLASWPGVALNHAITARLSERKRLLAMQPSYPVVIEVISAAKAANSALSKSKADRLVSARNQLTSALIKLNQ